MNTKNDLIAFSHLRWEFVYQRPQHLMTRFSQYRRILFVEEPISENESDITKVFAVNKSITVIQPRIKRENFFDDLAHIVKSYCNNLSIQNPHLWFYSAAFQKIIPYFSSHKIIYDCMDELSAFKNADPALINEEKSLLSKADIIFTGGKSLFEEKSKLAKNVFCFPSSVDRMHFQKALLAETVVPEELQSVIRPIIGYCGVIDERIDLHLLADIADLKKECTFVMVGPHVKIDPAMLPRRENIIYLGAKSYQILPQYLKEFDIAMMPFALNEATQFISPTKTLEYMAALRPIISTPIYDVVRDYQDIIMIIKSAQEFADAIDKIINETKVAKQQRIASYIDVLNYTSWDNTATKMWQLIDRIVLEKNSTKEQAL